MWHLCVIHKVWNHHRWVQLHVTLDTHQSFVNPRRDPSESIRSWSQRYQKLAVVNIFFFGSEVED